MNFTRMTALASGLTLVATWLVNAPRAPLTPPVPSTRSTARPPQPADPPLPVVQVNTRQLRSAAREAERDPEPQRNLFRFSERLAPLEPPRRVAALTPAPPPPVPAQAEPLFTLSGVAEDPGPQGPVRTAVIAGRHDLYLVREGDTVGGGYTVARIAPDYVELVPLAGGASILLQLEPTGGPESLPSVP